MLFRLLLQCSKYHWKVILFTRSNEMCTLKNQHKIYFIIFAICFRCLPFSFSSPCSFCDFLKASILVCIFPLSLTVKLCSSLKFHTLFNILLACLFLFMPAHFMWFLIIVSHHIAPPSPQIALYFPLPSTSCLLPTWQFHLPHFILHRKDRNQNITGHWKVLFCHLLLLNVLPMCLHSVRAQVCMCVSVCVISVSSELLSSGWPRGWWSVALPSSLCCQPQGDHTNTHACNDIKTTQTHMHAVTLRQM